MYLHCAGGISDRYAYETCMKVLGFECVEGVGGGGG